MKQIDWKIVIVLSLGFCLAIIVKTLINNFLGCIILGYFLGMLFLVIIKGGIFK